MIKSSIFVFIVFLVGLNLLYPGLKPFWFFGHIPAFFLAFLYIELINIYSIKKDEKEKWYELPILIGLLTMMSWFFVILFFVMLLESKIKYGNIKDSFTSDNENYKKIKEKEFVLMKDIMNKYEFLKTLTFEKIEDKELIEAYFYVDSKISYLKNTESEYFSKESLIKLENLKSLILKYIKE